MVIAMSNTSKVMKDNSVISVQNFSKSFGRNKVIDDLSFEVSKGEIFAFLGANGSGKTTTLRALLGIYSADKGELLINGVKYAPIHSSMLGYLPEERGLYTTSKVLETMVYFGQLKGMTREQSTKKAIQYLKRVGLEDKTQETIKKLSSGQQQKIQLGITVINSPKLLILDEPTKGLDPVNRDLLIELLLELNKQGATIIFSTHQMEEAEKIADRILMIKEGKKALYGELEEVKQGFGSNIIHLDYKGEFPDNPKLYTAHVEHRKAEVVPLEGVTHKEILSFLLGKIEISNFQISTPSLHEIFVRVTNQND